MTNDTPFPFTAADFEVETLEDEIRADRQCTELLKDFAATLVRKHGLPPRDAGALAHGADPFLRDFLIADRRENLFRPRPGRVRQYAGHFYIVSTLEPNRAELATILAGIEAFYRHCAECAAVSEQVAAGIAEECAEIELYAERIESFWALEGDGFLAWRDVIPLD